MEAANQKPSMVSSEMPAHRLDIYFQGEKNIPGAKNLAIMDAIYAAVSPIRGLEDLLCCGKFDAPEPVTKACQEIMYAALSDLDYVIKKWGAFEKLQKSLVPKVDPGIQVKKDMELGKVIVYAIRKRFPKTSSKVLKNIVGEIVSSVSPIDYKSLESGGA